MCQFSYDILNVPKNYVCCKCKGTNRKLWRLSNIFVVHQELYCAQCAKDKNAKQILLIEENGRCHSFEHGYLFMTDQINGLVPAVPTEDESSYWGYTFVPEDGVTWWKSLPLNERTIDSF